MPPRYGHRCRCRASRFRRRSPSIEDRSDAEILSDNLTQGAESRRGLREVVAGHAARPSLDRLGAIVGGAMGYEPEDLPWEVPLIELGLDSLMAVRIKNRVEYDFDLPPIQLTAVRDANLYNVESLIQYAIEHRDEVEELAEHQKTQTPEEIAAAQAELMGGATTVAELEEKLAEAGAAAATETPTAAPATDVPIPPPPTDPSGPKADVRLRQPRWPHRC